MWLIYLIGGLAFIVAVMVLFELFCPRMKKYSIVEKRIENPLRLVIISDLHGRKSFLKNKNLWNKINHHPTDLFLLSGDMITACRTQNYNVAYELIKRLSKIAPVYYALGNHEARCMTKSSSYYPEFMSYLNKVQKLDQVFVLNNSENIETLPVTIYGVNIDMIFYEKKRNRIMEEEKLFLDLLFKKDKKPLILLAHNPKFMELYFRCGADYIISGHYHGGMIRLPFIGGLISPDFKLFPKYSGGYYKHGQQHGFVTRGLGTHTIHFRLFNRCEVVQLDLNPDSVSTIK